MSATTDRGPTSDEPDVPYYVISSNLSTSSGTRKIHIPAAGGRAPICEAELHGDGKRADDTSEWKTKDIKTRPPSWRDGKWCKNCLSLWDGEAVQETDGGALTSGKLPSFRVGDELREHIDTHTERMGLTYGELARQAIRAYFVSDSGRDIKYDDEQLIHALADLADDLGFPPTTQDINSAEGVPSAQTYKNRFGDINTARELAGIEKPSGAKKVTPADTIKVYEYFRGRPSGLSTSRREGHVAAKFGVPTSHVRAVKSVVLHGGDAE